MAASNLTIDYNDMWQLGWRLSELVPLDMNERQRLLEIDDPLERLTRIEELVSEMANGS